MGGMNEWVEAETLTELKRKVQEAAKEMRETGMVVHHPWDPNKVEKTEKGYRFWIHAHT